MNMFLTKPEKLKKPINTTKHLLPIYTAELLLAHENYKTYLLKLKPYTLSSDAVFEDFYANFLTVFAEFVQIIPSQKNGAYGSLLNEALVRGRHLLVQWFSKDSNITPLEAYAMFTAGVLKDIGKVLVNQKVFLTNKIGDWQAEWDPLLGLMQKNGESEYFRIIYQGPAYQGLKLSIAPLLARQILPQAAFQWLSSDKKLFAEWLSILLGENREGGRLETNFQLFQNVSESADIIVISHPWFEAFNTEHADAFFNWLQNALTNGEVTPSSENGIYMTEEGVFVEISEKSGVFKEFADLYLTPVDAFTVFQQMGNLFGLVVQSGSDYRKARLFSISPHSPMTRGKFSLAHAGANTSVEGILLNPNLVFLHGNTPPIQSNYQVQSGQISGPDITLKSR